MPRSLGYFLATEGRHARNHFVPLRGSDQLSPSARDPRTRRSRKWLQDALKSLAQELPYEAITIQQIAARADVNRTTFYQHFQDKDDLLDSIASDLLQRLVEGAEQYKNEDWPFSPVEAPPTLLRFFEEIGNDARFYARMLTGPGSSAFASRLVSVLETHHIQASSDQNAKDAFPVRATTAPPDLVARFLSMGLIGSLAWWLANETPYTAQEAANYCWKMLYRLGDWDLHAPS